MTLLVLPLVIYAVVIFQVDYQARLNDLVLSLDAVGKSQKRIFEQLLEADEMDLSLFDTFKLQNPGHDLADAFREMATTEHLSSLFLLKQEESGTVCSYASDPRMVGLKNLFAEQVNMVEEGKAFGFLGKNPVSRLREIYLARFTQSGILIAGHDAQEEVSLIADIQGIHFPFHTTLLNEKGYPFVSSNPAFTLEGMQILLPTDIERKRSEAFHFFKKRPGRLGLKMQINKGLFYLLTDLPEEVTLEISTKQFLHRLLALLAIIFVIGGSATWFLMRRMAKPLQTLSGTMARVGEGHLSSRYTADRLGFEINVLGAQFNRMVEGLTRYIEEVRTEKLAKELLLKEFKIGHEIQKSIFPKQLPDAPNVKIATGFLPAYEVTGDFYDLFLQDNTLVSCIGDAAGKGVSACLYALLLRSSLRTVFHSMPADFASKIHRAAELFYLDTQDSGFFATAWIGELDLEKRVLHYACCGHLPGLLVRKAGTLEELSTPGIALGVEPKIELSVASTTLAPGDFILLYSDGIVEAHDREQRLFGMHQLREAVLEVKERSAQDIVRLILKKIEEFSTGAPQHDDLTLVVIKIE